MIACFGGTGRTAVGRGFMITGRITFGRGAHPIRQFDINKVNNITTIVFIAILLKVNILKFQYANFAVKY